MLEINAPLTSHKVQLLTFVTYNNFLISDSKICGKTGNSDGNNFAAGPPNHSERNPLGDWPWMASIGYYGTDNKWEHQCGATLITDKHFLTAAHCVNTE